MDKLHMALTELCYSLNYVATINVWEYTFAPREYLNQHLETRFARALAGMVRTYYVDKAEKRFKDSPTFVLMRFERDIPSIPTKSHVYTDTKLNLF